MASRVNAVALGPRDQGALIIHAPADCMDHYRGTLLRLRALQAPMTGCSVPIDWNGWDHEMDVALRQPSAIPGHAHATRCPTVTSDQLVGGTPFRFEEDTRDT